MTSTPDMTNLQAFLEFFSSQQLTAELARRQVAMVVYSDITIPRADLEDRQKADHLFKTMAESVSYVMLNNRLLTVVEKELLGDSVTVRMYARVIDPGALT